MKKPCRESRIKTSILSAFVISCLNWGCSDELPDVQENKPLRFMKKPDRESRIRTSILSALVVSCLNCGCSDAQHDVQEGVVNFEKSGDVVLNPGQGWILYGSPANHSTETMAMAATGYTRYNWNDINPWEDVYNWTLIDNTIDLWRRQGKQFAFGVMNVNIHGSVYTTPQWVFEKGAKYEMGKGYNSPGSNPNAVYYVPVWNDPVYVAACKKFTEALAERYDGNPNIAFIDIRNFGNWGEIHLFPLFDDHDSPERWPPVEDVREMLFKPYVDNFKHTQIMLNRSEPYLPFGDGLNDWAVENGLGLRSDGITGQYDTYADIITRAAGKTPTVWEFIDHYKNIEAQNRWNGSEFINAVEKNRPTFIGMGAWGDDAKYMLSRNPDLIKKVAGMIGYQLAMTSGTYTARPGAGEAVDVTLMIENTGLGAMLTPCVIKLVLLDKNGEAVSSFTTDWNARSLAPGTTTELTASVAFAGTPAGDYKLAIGLFRNETDAEPTYRMKNKGMSRAGYYVIGNLTVGGGENAGAAQIQ